jgi:acetyl esterase
VSVLELDPEGAAFLRQQAASGIPPIATLTPEQARANFVVAAAQFGEVEKLSSVEDTDADGVPVRIYRPDDSRGPSLGLVYFHGGGWVVGSVDTHDGITRALAKHAGCVVVSVDYRLAPEHPYPAALDDAWTAARWVLEHAAELGLDDERIGVGGDSVGGNLAAVIARRGRDHGMPFAAQLLIYPTTSTRTDTPSYETFASGYGLTREAMRWYWRQYLGDSDGSTNPDISPSALVDTRRLPRAIVVTAEADVLRDEAETYGQRLFLGGIETEGYRYDGMIHGFLRLAGVVGRSREALREIAGSLRPALEKGWRERFDPVEPDEESASDEA